MSTFGEMRFRLMKDAKGCDPDLMDGWINDRHQRMLRCYPWKHLRIDYLFSSVAPYATGTAAVTLASSTIVGAGTTWTAGMSGRKFRATPDSQFYIFTQTGNTTGTLDRPYEAATNAAVGYSLFQDLFAMPAEALYVTGVRLLSGPGRALRLAGETEINLLDPARTATPGAPKWYTVMGDNSATPPQTQVSLLPYPDAIYGHLARYIKAIARFGIDDTAVAFLPWIREDAIVAGATADYLRSAEKYEAAVVFEKLYDQGIAEMQNFERLSMSPSELRQALDLGMTVNK